MKKLLAWTVAAWLSCLPPMITAEIQLPELGDSAGALVSPIQEHYIGLSFYWKIQQSVDLIDDPEVSSYLSNLGYRLASHSDEPGRSYTFFMVPDPAVNAFAAPGGFIGVHSGLILLADTEDEVASVISHEIAHITQRHLLRSFEKSKNLSIPMTAALIGAALLGIADPGAGSAAMMAVQAGNVQMQLDYTRAHEAEADNLGMLTLVRSGFDPNAMPSFFTKLDQVSRYYGNNVPEFLRTHPVTTTRIAEAKGRASEYKKQTKLTDESQFYLIKEKLRVLTSRNLNELTDYYKKQIDQSERVPDAVRYGYALALLKSSQYTLARQQLQVLLDKEPDRLSYQLALADIEMSVGRIDSALNIYQNNQKLYPDDRALSLNQVAALLQTGRPYEASVIIKRQLDLGETSRDLYKLLSQAYGDMGRKSEAHRALAEYYYLSGRLNGAADQLRLAAEVPGINEYEKAQIASRLREVETNISLLEQK